MTSTAIQAITEVATFVISVGASLFIGGYRWGEVRSEVRNINERLAKIEGMFTLRLRNGKDENQ